MIKNFLLFCVVVGIAAPDPIGFADERNVGFRLPNDTIPIHYYLTLATDIHDGTSAFAGKVRITIDVAEETSVVTMHNGRHTITRIDLFNNTGTPIEPPLIEGNIVPILIENFELVQIPTSLPLVIDQQYIIEITFNNTLNDNNSGFYRSFYNTTEGVRWLAATQFEATGARHAFPCYDEPRFRSTFTIDIEHDMTYNAISNWPVDSILPVIGTNKYITTFKETYPMPTYLIAFVISDFDFIEEGNQRVYARPEAIAAGEMDFALRDGIRILQICEDLWGVPYTLPKLYQVAVPDFAFGGMEEWGILTYREEVLLLDNQTATLRTKEGVSRLMSHEFAHLWFGNLISPSWWSYLWVKEAFGQFYAIYLNHLLYPDDRWMDTFVVDSIHNALTLDANPNIRSMTHNAETPAELAGLFDVVAYDKAASVIWMMENAIGNTTYNKGLTYYLQISEHQSTGSDELYAGIQESINEDFAAPNRLDFTTIMRTWEFQSGYPVISVSRMGNQLNFRQERFFYTNATSENLWWVPINYVVGSNPNFTSTLPNFWIRGVPAVNVTNLDYFDWVVVNIQESGYYRVNYDTYLWNLLRVQLNFMDFTDIHVLNRAQIVDDSLNLAQANRIDYGIALGILRYLSRETDHVPWAAANRGMTLLNRWLASTDVYPLYQSFVRQIVAPLLDHLGYDLIPGEHRLDVFARTNGINIACEAQLPSCLTQIAQRYEQAMNGNSIAPDLQPAVFCSGLRNGNATHFSFIHARLRGTQNQGERALIQFAMACSQDFDSLLTFVRTALTTELRMSERFRVLTIAQNSGDVGLRVMIELIRNNFDELINVATGQVNTMLSSISARVSSEERFNEFNSLLTNLLDLNRITEAAATNFRTAARVNLNWQEVNLAEIREWLEINVDS